MTRDEWSNFMSLLINKLHHIRINNPGSYRRFERICNVIDRGFRAIGINPNLLTIESYGNEPEQILLSNYFREKLQCRILPGETGDFARSAF